MFVVYCLLAISAISSLFVLSACVVAGRNSQHEAQFQVVGQLSQIEITNQTSKTFAPSSFAPAQ